MQNRVNTQTNTISAQEFLGKTARDQNKVPKHAQKLTQLWRWVEQSGSPAQGTSFTNKYKMCYTRVSHLVDCWVLFPGRQTDTDA